MLGPPNTMRQTNLRENEGTARLSLHTFNT